MTERRSAEEEAVLRTARLVLRRWRPDDLDHLTAMNTDPDVMRYFPMRPDRQQSAAMMAWITTHIDRHGFGLWALEIPGVHRFAGFVGLFRPTFHAHFTPCIEVGWRLVRTAWGHGYATEAALASLRFGFEHVALEEIVSFTVPQNKRSVAVMERIGLVRDAAGDFDRPMVDPEAHAELVHHVFYRLDRQTWQIHQRLSADPSILISRS